MKFKRVAAYALALSLMMVPLAGCASGGAGDSVSGGAKAKNDVCGFSKRQQLICLKKVWRAGAISKEEYNRAWQRIVDRN